jgi:hypothetical protein
MPFGTTTLSTRFPEREPWQVRVLRAVLWFIPRASPDNERLYSRVRSWAIEIDAAGKPIREVGVDQSGAALFRAPDDRNHGFWTDSPMTFTLSDLDSMSESEFEQLWSKAPRRSA